MTEIILMSDPRVAAIPVQDCAEPLVDVRTTLHTAPLKTDDTGAYARLREGVLARLLTAQQHLPDGLRLLFVEGYRPPALQREYFEGYVAELRTAHPDWSPACIHTAASRYVSPPDIAPHSAGAAVDLTLVTPAARENRRVLGEALSTAGLVNYPTEWWHWSYGDRYWALVTGAPTALYGPRE
ncbi:M15 family metallopeptidase [Streptomyces acidiscabies]|uniref:M15 family metallopeptidase n=1 Tax=Streptomyces acidiscabies TaxID=42234 RepID=UPI0030D3DFC9